MCMFIACQNSLHSCEMMCVLCFCVPSMWIWAISGYPGSRSAWFQLMGVRAGLCLPPCSSVILHFPPSLFWVKDIVHLVTVLIRTACAGLGEKLLLSLFTPTVVFIKRIKVNCLCGIYLFSAIFNDQEELIPTCMTFLEKARTGLTVGCIVGALGH